MRRLLFTLLCGLIAAPAALAYHRASGDGILELKNTDALTTISGRGALWGQVDSGRIIIVDPNANDGDISVSGAEHMFDPPGDATIYWGKNIHFRITGGTYRITFKALAGDTALDPVARGIDLTAVGVGKMTIVGEQDPTDDPGYYALNGGKWRPVPLIQTIIPFDDQAQ